MTASGAVRSVLGLALVVGGAGLFYVALETQSQRAAAQAIAALPPATGAPAVPAASLPAASMTAAAPPLPSAPDARLEGLDAGADAAGDAGRDGGDGGRPDASDAVDGAAAGTSPDSFRFGAGGIVLPREEISRLVSFGKQLGRGEKSKVVIEGYGDEVGSDEKTLTLGRRRATVVRQLFSEVGVDPDRLSIASPDAAAEPRLAGTTRVRVVAAAEGKAP